MMNFAIAVGVLLFAAAGYLAYRNSRLISMQQESGQKYALPAWYTVCMGSELPGAEEDDIPLWAMEYETADGVYKAGLCRVPGDTAGDLKLEQAEQMLSAHVRTARAGGTYLSHRTFEDRLQDEQERNMAKRLSQAAVRV